MKIISFIERCQQDVIERTLRHCGLWEGTLATARAPPPACKPRPAEPSELEVVLDDEFLEFQRRQKQRAAPGELQLVLDPEFL